MECRGLALLIFLINDIKGRVSMNILNNIETAVFREIIKKSQEEAGALAEQIRHAVVKERNNTGSGFYTRVEVKSSDLLIKSRVLSNVFVKIEGMKNPVAFVLFIKDGKIDLLEGAATEDSTVGIDFSTADFEVM